MKLTPLDIKKQTFQKKVRGFDTQEVTFFLDEVADSYEELLTERNQLSDKIIELETNLKRYSEVEQTLKDTLITAQESSTRSIENSQQKAVLIIREAELKANKILQEAEQQEAKIQERIYSLINEKRNFAAKLKHLASSQIEFVTMIEQEIDESQFSKLLAKEPKPEIIQEEIQVLEKEVEILEEEIASTETFEEKIEIPQQEEKIIIGEPREFVEKVEESQSEVIQEISEPETFEEEETEIFEEEPEVATKEEINETQEPEKKVISTDLQKMLEATLKQVKKIEDDKSKGKN
ncbi:MAG: DivIVA domain-containing protein [Calditrichaeota bacterium]|nr:MAG: DivIVA domain-containing protein [Calditrichota bacterium]